MAMYEAAFIGCQIGEEATDRIPPTGIGRGPTAAERVRKPAEANQTLILISLPDFFTTEGKG